jgi:hypothetical protein
LEDGIRAAAKLSGVRLRALESRLLTRSDSLLTRS